MILNALERIIADGSKSIIVFTFDWRFNAGDLDFTPALCATLLSNQTLFQEDTFVSLWAERLYNLSIDLLLRSPQIILDIALAHLVAGCAIVSSLGQAFLPRANASKFTREYT